MLRERAKEEGTEARKLWEQKIWSQKRDFAHDRLRDRRRRRRSSSPLRFAVRLVRCER